MTRERRLNAMTPEEIKAKMVLRKITYRNVAKRAGVVPSTVTMVVQRKGKSRKIERIIANDLGLPYSEVWGKTAPGADLAKCADSEHSEFPESGSLRAREDSKSPESGLLESGSGSKSAESAVLELPESAHLNEVAPGALFKHQESASYADFFVGVLMVILAAGLFGMTLLLWLGWGLN